MITPASTTPLNKKNYEFPFNEVVVPTSMAAFHWRLSKHQFMNDVINDQHTTVVQCSARINNCAAFAGQP